MVSVPGSPSRRGCVNIVPAFLKSPMTLSPAGLVPSRTHLTRSSNAFALLFNAEAAVVGDPVDALDEQILPARGGHGAIEDLLQVDRHEQVARAVHREQRPLDPAIERHDFVVRTHRVADVAVGGLPAHGLVQPVGRQPERVVKAVTDMRRRHRAVRRRCPAGQCGRAGSHDWL